VLDIREELRGLLAPSVTEPRTLVELSIEWLPRKKRKLASADSFDGRVRHVLRALGHHTYQTLLPRHVEDMMDALLASELSAQTVNHVRDAGRQLVADAARNRLWPGPNPFEDVPKRKVPPHAYDMPSRDETAMLLGAVEEEHQPLVALALYLGPRRKTIFNIQPADVSLARGTMDFRVTKTGVVILGVPVPDELTPFLREAMRRARGEWLFSRPDGRQLSSRSRLLRSVLSRAIARAGLRRGARLMRLTFRDLRGVCATLHQEAGAHPWVVSKVLGHSQSSLVIAENMTARRYSKFSDEFARRELNRLSLKP
jgi:integrase